MIEATPHVSLFAMIPLLYLQNPSLGPSHLDADYSSSFGPQNNDAYLDRPFGPSSLRSLPNYLVCGVPAF